MVPYFDIVPCEEPMLFTSKFFLTILVCCENPYMGSRKDNNIKILFSFLFHFEVFTLQIYKIKIKRTLSFLKNSHYFVKLCTRALQTRGVTGCRLLFDCYKEKTISFCFEL